MGYWLLPGRFRNYFLLLASYYFYYTYNPWFLLLLIGTSAFDFWCAKQIERVPDKKKFYLYLSVLSNVGILAAFKYSAFLFNSGVYTANYMGGTNYSLMDNLIIPAGLSFYTLQSLSYTIDVYRGRYKPNDTLYEFLLYVSFFPHMVAGPVVRYNTLMPQLKIISYFKQIDWSSFAQLTIWGYFKKMVIADNLDSVVGTIFNNVSHYSGFELLFGGCLFVIQVYCDFSGYSDIATGVAKLFNINLSLNWRRPLLSSSLHEFWRRNHISITTWFRDYLYIGLGGNRVSYKRWLLNIFLVFLISGLWHGANLTFIIWGAMHGVMYIIEILLRKRFPTVRIPGFLGWIYLMAFHTFSLIAFRAANISDLSYIYRHIFSSELFEFRLYSPNDLFQFLMIISLVAFLFFKELNEEYAFVNRCSIVYKNMKPVFYISLIIIMFMIGNFKANTFIYFQF
jgi:alginate O-acetyltransferase complex protein AlgI